MRIHLMCIDFLVSMGNPFSYLDYVTGEAFCDRAAEQKDLIHYAQKVGSKPILIPAKVWAASG